MVFCSCLALSSACSRDAAEARLLYLAPDARILAFGDSLTYGTGANESDSYPVHLQALIDREVIAAGVPGETTGQGLIRLPSVLEETEPELVILCLGGNDMLRRQDRDQMKQNLSAMIRLIQQHGAQVMLIGVPEPALFGLDVEPSYGELARQFVVPLEDQALPSILSDDSRKADKIHPNAEGYRDLARAVAELLRRAGAV